MIFRNLIFEPEVVKQRLRAGMVSHHEQQASKCNGEQQHRALWPAYNLNIAPPQASTEGLFQQTRLIASTIWNGGVFKRKLLAVRSIGLLVAIMVTSLGTPTPLSGQHQAELVLHQYEGNLGDARIGLTVKREGNKIVGGHYFYQKFLRDIPITGSTENSHITLAESGEGTFHLHFVGNGSEKGQPLDFD